MSLQSPWRPLFLAALAASASSAWCDTASAREPREWALFDPDLSTRRAGLGLGYAELDLPGDEARRGLSLELWGSIRTTRRRAYAELRQTLMIGAFENSTFLFGASQALHAGVALGVLRLGSGFGVAPIGFDLSPSDATLHVLSPSAFLLLGLEVRRVQIAVRGEVRYLFRLFGREDAALRSLVLQVGLERQRRQPPRRVEPYFR